MTQKDEVIKALQEEEDTTLSKIEVIEKRLNQLEKKLDLILELVDNWRPSKRQVHYVLNLASKVRIDNRKLKEITQKICKVDRIQDIKRKIDYENLVKYLTRREK